MSVSKECFDNSRRFENMALEIEGIIISPFKLNKQTTMRPRIIIIKKHLDASTEEPKCQICKEIAYLTKKQAPVQLVPVLFMFGVPQRILKITEVIEYQTLGANVKYIKETEIKL